MDKKEKLNHFVTGAEKVAKGLLDNAIRVVDQNDDGKLDMADVSAIASTVGNAVKKGTHALKATADEKSRMLELKALQPIFTDSLDSADFFMPKFIRIAARDKRHSESEVCQGSIGYHSDQKGLRIVNIFRDSVESFGLNFFPDCDCEFYYADPTDRDSYIALDEYFHYLKEARVNELEKIAQDLGAKHFRITYKEARSSFTDKKTKAGAEMKGAAKANLDHHSTEKEYTSVEIASEMEFPGHAPTKPTLKYMQREPNIQNLIAMRMDPSSPLMHKKYMLELSRSSGIKESDAIKIDAVLKGMKCSGNASVASEAQNEARRFLEYEIDF